MLVVVLSRLKSISFSLERGHSQRSSVNSADYRCSKRLLEDEEEELKDLNKTPPPPTPTTATTTTSPIPFKCLHRKPTVTYDDSQNRKHARVCGVNRKACSYWSSSVTSKHNQKQIYWNTSAYTPQHISCLKRKKESKKERKQGRKKRGSNGQFGGPGKSTIILILFTRK